MDFMNRGFRNGQPNTQNVEQTANTATSNNSLNKGKSGGRFSSSNLSQAGKIGFLALIVLLIVLALAALFTFKGGSSEAKLVDSSKYQAVFLNGGQVYFGKVADLNSRYVKVNNVYYLRVNQQVQPDANAQNSSNDISLVKLGCELHGPQDQMIVNREQVVFWENLKDDGQVAKAIAQYKEQFPNGQNCDEQSGTTGTQNNSGASGTEQTGNEQGGNNNNTTTPPAATPPATPPANNNSRQ